MGYTSPGNTKRACSKVNWHVQFHFLPSRHKGLCSKYCLRCNSKPHIFLPQKCPNITEQCLSIYTLPACPQNSQFRSWLYKREIQSEQSWGLEPKAKPPVRRQRCMETLLESSMVCFWCHSVVELALHISTTVTLFSRWLFKMLFCSKMGCHVHCTVVSFKA